MRPSLAVFLCGLCLSLAVRPPDVEMIDEMLPLYSAISLADHSGFDIPVTAQYHPHFYRTAPDGKLYPKFGPGQAVILSPFAAAGLAFSGSSSSIIDVRPIVQAGLFFGSLVVPLISVLAFRFWRHLGYSHRASALSAILLVATSELLPYSRSLFGDLSCAALGFGAFCAIGMMAGKSLIPPALAGSCLGLAVLVRPVTILFTAPFVLYAALVWKRNSVSAALCARQFLSAAVPFALFCFSFLLFNRYAFGAFFSTGYESEIFLFDLPFGVGAPHILFSLEKGFFVYSPSAALSILFWAKFHRAHRAESISAVLLFAVYVYVYAGWYASGPGNELSYGQRFLLPVLPLAYLALPECVERMRPKISGAVFGAVFTASFLVQVAGCLQTGGAFRAWAAQFESPVWPPLGYLLKSVQNPETIAVWWWRSGGVGVTIGLGLIFLAGFFCRKAVRD